jgi:hypothetical protein
MISRKYLFAGLIALGLSAMLVQSSVAGWNSFGRGVKGSGDKIAEERDLPEFNRIEISGSIDVRISVGEKQAVILHVDDNLAELFVTKVKRNKLKIFTEESYRNCRKCYVEIIVPELIEVSLSGSADVSVEGLTGEEFIFEKSGSGDFTVEGDVDLIEIDLTGSGDVDARYLVSKSAYVEIHGSGDVEVYATENFRGRVYGSGDIAYYGNPEDTSTRVYGSGSIRKRR